MAVDSDRPPCTTCLLSHSPMISNPVPNDRKAVQEPLRYRLYHAPRRVDEAWAVARDGNTWGR
jgi:hypothetical protein